MPYQFDSGILEAQRRPGCSASISVRVRTVGDKVELSIGLTSAEFDNEQVELLIDALRSASSST
jgi:hypothetical protein